MRTCLSLFAAVTALVAGCGSERPPPAGSSGFTPGSSGAAGGGFQDAGGSNKPPGCGQKDDGSFCECIDVPLFGEAPNMYFVLDRSGSMAEGNKWAQVRGVVAEIVRTLGPRANFGATVFPGFDQSSCAPARQILPISPGDPRGTGDGPTTAKLLQGTINAPNGGTPTAEALRAVLETLRTAKGKTFAILATDGGPNCNAGASCGADQCQPNIDSAAGCSPTGPSCCEPPEFARENCLDSGPTTSAVAALKAFGIPVYVIGLPGTSTYASLLDQLAVSGGTALAASPKYYKVDTAGESALLAALKKIAAQIVATCEFKLKEAPASANLVNVYFDEKVVPKDPVNGWKIEGSTVTLIGQSCDKVRAGDVLDVRIIAGCPTVEPR